MEWNRPQINNKSKSKVQDLAQYPVLRIAQNVLHMLLREIPVQSNTVSASQGSIQPRCN